MQAIVYNLLSDGDQSFDHISNYSPFYEVSRTWDEESGCLSPQFTANHSKLRHRVFNTHLRHNMMPQGNDMKSIYVVRGGKDVALSFYCHLSNQDDADNYQGNLSDFLKDWLAGKIIFGSWIKHIESWCTAYHADMSSNASSKILIVRYEDLITDLPEQMWCIASFLQLSLTKQRVNELSSFVTFAYMKSHSAQFSPTSVPWKTGFEFIREGKMGGSKDAFSAEDATAFDQMVQKSYPEMIPFWLAELDVLR